MKQSFKHKMMLIMAAVAIMSIRQMPTAAQGVSNDYESRVSATFSYKLLSDLKIKLTPELRFDEEFSIDESLLEAKLVYSPFQKVSFFSSYRFIANYKQNKDTELMHRVSLGSTLKMKMDRFTPALKLSYSNYADDDIMDKEFFRYKLSVDYDIRNSKFEPFAGIEAYQDLTDFSTYKIRYSTGVEYKLKKNNYIGLSYKLDYYMQKYKNKHVFSLGYKYNF